MRLQLTPEMSAALQAGRGDVRLIDPETQRTYVLVDEATYSKAIDALRQNEHHQAIRAGIDDMEAGRMQPAEDAWHHGRAELLSRNQ